ncbi:MAG TPA: type I methionyl aminopeptidase [Patescibacteria group bacterium]|nr:type I methionyl aminopeptidase [Patescibacteria group bacterium]
MIPLKSNEDLEMMRQAGRIAGRLMQQLCAFVKVGISTAQIDALAESLIRQEQAKAAFKGYRGYPANICASVNEEIVHGIPGSRLLEEGDIISLDVGVDYQGYFSDVAATLAVGKVSAQKKKLIQVTRQALAEGIKKAQVNNHLSDISCAVQAYVESHGFSVVRDFVGHGIGRNLHEEPEIPNFGQPHQGPVLKCGMVLAIEPMVNMGGWEAKVLDNGWTAVTKDGLPSAHFEHTVAITREGPRILTS